MPPRAGLPVLAVLGGQRPVQLLDDAAGGQRPVDGGMRGPRGRGELPSEGRVRVLPTGVLEEHRLAWEREGPRRTHVHRGRAAETGAEGAGPARRARSRGPGTSVHADTEQMPKAEHDPCPGDLRPLPPQARKQVQRPVPGGVPQEAAGPGPARGPPCSFRGHRTPNKELSPR